MRPNSSRRSLPKEESPRSGLKPHDTLGADDRRQSACSLAERRIEEHRKYSSYGIESPIPIELPCSSSQLEPERSPSICYSKKPVRSLSAGWRESFRVSVQRVTRKLNVFRRASPSTLSTRSTQQFLVPSPELSCKSNPETVKMKKSISFSETTRNAFRRSFRQKVRSLFDLAHIFCQRVDMITHFFLTNEPQHFLSPNYYESFKIGYTHLDTSGNYLDSVCHFQFSSDPVQKTVFFSAKSNF
ncbi:hypothetical protein B9Z55_023949 [Caenorhabditis nigoni]|uniref:Uncharacterized protein n=1 Tax=Caenorhabditis nigoni TaxID=1611254 RepID=A0A2G5SRX0_9PELO|nr:hypothetical protein B9Z55_023949 [Caenorhabditis nigoni]